MNQKVKMSNRISEVIASTSSSINGRNAYNMPTLTTPNSASIAPVPVTPIPAAISFPPNEVPKPAEGQNLDKKVIYTFNNCTVTMPKN